MQFIEIFKQGDDTSRCQFLLQNLRFLILTTWNQRLTMQSSFFHKILKFFWTWNCWNTTFGMTAILGKGKNTCMNMNLGRLPNIANLKCSSCHFVELWLFSISIQTSLWGCASDFFLEKNRTQWKVTWSICSKFYPPWIQHHHSCVNHHSQNSWESRPSPPANPQPKCQTLLTALASEFLQFIYWVSMSINELSHE